MWAADDRREIAAVRAELAEIAQTYNVAGTEILNRLYPRNYFNNGRMPGTLRSLGYAYAPFERLAVLYSRTELDPAKSA